MPLVYVARDKSIQTGGGIPGNIILFFSYIAQLLPDFSLWQRLSTFTQYELLAGQTALLAWLKV